MSAKRSYLLSVPVDCVLADASFDSERGHTFCREQLKAGSSIPANASLSAEQQAPWMS
jgi:hypothetical protein